VSTWSWRAKCHRRGPPTGRPSIYTTCQPLLGGFPKSPIHRIGPPRPLSRVHWCIHPCPRVKRRLGLKRARARQNAKFCKSCMRLHKRSSRLGRGAGSASRPLWTAVCSGKCLPSRTLYAVRGYGCLFLRRPKHLARPLDHSGCWRRANPLARGIRARSTCMRVLRCKMFA